MAIDNLSRPGQSPQAGDWVRITTPNGTTEREWHDETLSGPRIIGQDAFMDRFGLVLIAAIITAARTDAMVEALLTRLKASPTVNLDSELTVDGINYLLSQAIITADDKARVLA